MLRWVRGFVLPTSGNNEDKESNRRFENLFWQLDRYGTGKVDIVQLQEGLLQLSAAPSQDASKSGDSEKDMKKVFDEFKKYLKNRGKKLKLTFKSLEKSDSGKVEPSDIVQAFKILGTNVSKLQATYILRSLDEEGTMSVDWNEWTSYFLFNTIANYEEMIQFWKHSTIIDIGESLSIPDEFTEDDRVSGQRWRHVLAGMVASAISRTCTAPLERLKVIMQAQNLPLVTLNLKTGFENMLKEGGVISFWKGNYMHVLRIAPETSIKYWSYEKYKNLLAAERTTMGLIDRFVSGSLAGITAQTLIYPLELLKNFWLRHYSRDSVNPGILLLLSCATLSSTCGQLASYPFTLVRTRMQAEETLRGIPPLKMIRLIKIIIATEGVIGFYKGIIPNVVKVLPAVCISYTVYEKTKRRLGVVECEMLNCCY